MDEILDTDLCPSFDPCRPIVCNEEKAQFTINYTEAKDKEDSVKTVNIGRETDRRRLEVRQRQIDIGKNTDGYKNFRKDLKRRKRQRDDPRTPDKHQICSKRSWDGQMSVWRRKLHAFDPKE